MAPDDQPIAFADLGRSTAALRGALDEALARVLDSGYYVLGPEVEGFERELAELLDVPHAVGVASGTDALEIALRVLDVGPGDEVITQANTCVPTVAAIERAGATPVLCDVEAETATIDLASLDGAFSPRTRAVIPVHLFGQVGDLDGVLALAAEHGVPVVEDCAQAVLAGAGGELAGTRGALGAFSLYPTKNLGALGDGGAVVTSDPELDARLRRVRMYGQADRYHSVERGINSRLDELQAAMLRVKLVHLRHWHARRQELAGRYERALDGTPVRPLALLPGRDHAFHLYVVRAPDRDAYRERMDELGVGTLVHYPLPIHGHEPYRWLADGPVSLANAEELAGQVVSLPLYPELTDAEVERVAAAAREAALAQA